MSKDELKETLEKFVLKVKFEYRIKRSSKTHFATLCRDIACIFELRTGAVQGGNYWTVTKFVKDHNCDMKMFRNCHWQVPTKVIGTIIVLKLQYKGRIIRSNDVVGEMQTDHGIRILYCKTWKVKEYAQNVVYNDLLHKNEWDSSDDDEEYIEPTRNNSNHAPGNASFDLHIESILMDNEYTQTILWKQNFINLLKKVHRKTMLKESGWFLGMKITPFKPFTQWSHQ